MTLEEALIEAKIRFPIGTVFSNEYGAVKKQS